MCDSCVKDLWAEWTWCIRSLVSATGEPSQARLSADLLCWTVAGYITAGLTQTWGSLWEGSRYHEEVQGKAALEIWCNPQICQGPACSVCTSPQGGGVAWKAGARGSAGESHSQWVGITYCRCPQENRRREDLWRLQSHPESSIGCGPASTSKAQRLVCHSCRRQSVLKTWPHTGLPPNGGGGEIPALAHNHHSQRALSLSPLTFWHLFGPSSIPTDYGADPARDSRSSRLHGRHRADRSNSRRTLGQTGPSTSAARGARPQTAEVPSASSWRTGWST